MPNVVKGFTNSYQLAESKCANTMKSFSMKVLSRVLLDKDEDLNNAADRARLCYLIVQHLGQGERQDLDTEGPCQRSLTNSEHAFLSWLQLSNKDSFLPHLPQHLSQSQPAKMFEIKARLVLAILAFTLFVVVQIARVNINIAVIVLENTSSIHGISDKAIILGSFYWCYWMTELPGAFLAQKYGSRMVLAVSILASGLGSLAFPMAYWCHPICAAFVRAFQGLAMVHQLEPHLQMLWVDSYLPNTTGNISSTVPVCCPFCGHWSGGAVHLIHQHSILTKHLVPWRDMLMSKAFWAVLLATLGLMWSVITLAMQLPSYLAQVHQVDIKTASFKLTCHLLPATLLFLLAFYGHCHLTVAITLIISTITIGGASASGTISNMVDISPNNAGIIMGTVKTLCVIPGILSPILVQYLTTCVKDEKKYLQDEIGSNVLQMSNYKIPWKPMLKSKAFWGNILGQFSTMWLIVPYSVQLPAFVHSVYGVSVKTSRNKYKANEAFAFAKRNHQPNEYKLKKTNGLVTNALQCSTASGENTSGPGSVGFISQPLSLFQNLDESKETTATIKIYRLPYRPSQAVKTLPSTPKAPKPLTHFVEDT
ncbi:Vesicular glutamate transporter [Carabus blaptoides fortunei]